MRFGKPIECKRADGLNDLALHRLFDSPPGHALAELGGYRFHPLVAALKGHCPAQFVRFRPGEPGHVHPHAKHLFLEQRHAQRAFQYLLAGRMDVIHSLTSIAPVEVWMNEIPDDRPGANNGDLDRQIIKRCRPHDGQSCHLSPGFHLEGAHRIRPAEQIENGGVILGDFGEIHRRSSPGADLQRVLDGGEHAEPQQVDFDDAEILAIIFVPLNDRPSRHRGGLERNHRIQAVIAHDHPAGMLAEMPGHSKHRMIEIRQCRQARV